VKLPEPLFLLINPMMRMLLRSPLHGLMSKSLMLISFKGRNSGKIYTTPVRYIQVENKIQCFTAMSNQWWRNIDPHADVVLRIAGRDYACKAEAIKDDPERVRSAVLYLLQHFPADAPYYEISLEPDGLPRDSDLEMASHKTVLVEAMLET
jgi:F420H(2)-dependent quinone reductase